MYFDQRKNEEVVEIIRKSFALVYPKVFKSFALVIPAIFALLYFDYPFLSLASLGWIIIIASYTLYSWLVWYYDIYILTSERIIAIEHRSLFAKDVVELDLDKIQDINYSIDGVGSALFGYGTVKISSETSVKIDLKSIKSPKETQELILELKKK